MVRKEFKRRVNEALDDLYDRVINIVEEASEDTKQEMRLQVRRRFTDDDYRDDRGDGDCDRDEDAYSIADYEIVSEELVKAKGSAKKNKNHYILIRGRKIMLRNSDGSANSDGSRYAKDGHAKVWMYQRPSGGKIWVPEQGSIRRTDTSFKIVAEIAVRKLTHELNWIDAGKPPRWNWAC